jgi:hypothetical protein
MKFPKVIRHRQSEVTIYGKKPNYPFYRIAHRVAGKRHLRNFSKYGEALKEAESKVRELAEGSQAAALTANQSRELRFNGWKPCNTPSDVACPCLPPCLNLPRQPPSCKGAIWRKS